MELYAIVDEDMRIVRHKGKLGVFTDLDMLKLHAWRYVGMRKNYKIAELEIADVFHGEANNGR